MLRGPPGVARRRWGKSIARALGRKFELSLGGLHEKPSCAAIAGLYRAPARPAHSGHAAGGAKIRC